VTCFNVLLRHGVSCASQSKLELFSRLLHRKDFGQLLLKFPVMLTMSKDRITQVGGSALSVHLLLFVLHTLHFTTAI